MVLLADRPLPPVAPAEAVEASRSAAAPELAPVSPFVHLHCGHDYEWHDAARELSAGMGERDGWCVTRVVRIHGWRDRRRGTGGVTRVVRIHGWRDGRRGTGGVLLG